MIARSFELRWCCWGLTLLASALLASSGAIAQVASPVDRYGNAGVASPPGLSGANNVGGAAPAAANNPQGTMPPAAPAASGSQSPFSGSASAAANGPANKASAPPNSPATGPYGQGTSPGGPAQRITPFSGANNQPLPGTNQTRPTQPGYPSAPPAVDSSNSTTGTTQKPSGLMRDMLMPPQGSRLLGRPTSLQEVVAGAQNRGEQSLRVDAYWDLCSSVADYYLGLQEQDELRQLRSLVQQVGATWSQAESELNIRVGTSQRAALASQLRLASLIGRGSNDLLLPTDAPHCASYDTQFDRIFVNGAPAEARELAAVLPARYAELRNAAIAVARGKEWVRSVARSDSDGTGTLRALELWALQRRAFVQIARDYNRRIARYAELASPGQLSPVRLTAMLIYTSASASPVPDYTAPPRNRQAATPTQPRTFVAGATPAMQPISSAPSNANAVLPASAEQNPLDQPADVGGEKSLIVAPLKP